MKGLDKKKSIVLCLLLAGLIVFGLPVAVSASEFGGVGVLGDLNPEAASAMAGTIAGTGTRFEITNSSYINMTLESSEPVCLMLESVPEMVVVKLDAAEGATSTQVTLSGLSCSTTYYKYEDNYHNTGTFTTDATGSYRYSQDLSREHLVFILPRPSTKFIPSDSSIGTWDAGSRTYTLSTDVNETIQIDEDNLTLDGAGHTVIGSGTSYGIYLNGRTGVTVRNVNVEEFSYGIGLYNSTGNTVMNNNTSWNSRYGIYLRDSNGNILTDNTASDNHEGIFLRDSNDNTLTANNTSNNYSGIYLYHNCNNTTLTDNTASKNSHGIYLYDSSSNTLAGNTANSNNYYGIHLNNSSNNSLTDNTTNWNHSSGIYLNNSSSNTLTANTTSHNYPGIYFYYNCNNNILTVNTASNNYFGIYLSHNCNNNEIYNNNFINNQTQAYTYSCSGNVFSLAAPTGGNYWSDWTTPDGDRDGLVDNHYVFTSGEDNLPWVRQYAWSNAPPVADAGADQEAHPRDVVTLDASGSSDAESDYPLVYSWQFSSKPEGSTAILSSPDTVNPSFTVDMLGDYIIELIVTDSLGAQSEPDYVQIGTYNAQPVADAGADQEAHPRDVVALDASGSSDPESDYPLTYSWQFSSEPEGSIAVLSDPCAVNPSFTVDMLGDYVIELIVTDSLGAQSEPDYVQIGTYNAQPVADAGADQVVHPRDVVALDASGSSDTESDYPLTYSWQFSSKPEGSTAILSSPDAENPSFTVDMLGDYVIELIVTDSLGAQSEPDYVQIGTYNTQPVAAAGADQVVHPITVVTLDASGSSDAESDYPLAYSWQFSSKPTGSTAVLSDPCAVNPSFTVDVLGDYIIELIVTDSLDMQSEPDSVLVGTYNTSPVANAGPDQTIILLGTTVELNGSLSSDTEGDGITYFWTITSPAGSTAELSDPCSATPSFVADIHSDYVITLIVTDVFGAVSAADSVTVSFENIKPVADVAVEQSVMIGDTVALDGSGSTDGNGDLLSYSWSLTSVPPGSLAEIVDPTSVQTSFTVDEPGTYIVSLLVNDGFEDSDAVEMTITAITYQEAAARVLVETIAVVGNLAPEILKNGNVTKDSIINKIEVVLDMIGDGRYENAVGKLINDVVEHTDGCADIGEPDSNDWIITCDGQNQVYPLIMEAIGYLQNLI
ncbi:MAG: PKD domain-containing protein [Planctomycetota bacterium]